MRKVVPKGLNCFWFSSESQPNKSSKRETNQLCMSTDNFFVLYFWGCLCCGLMVVFVIVAVVVLIIIPILKLSSLPFAGTSERGGDKQKDKQTDTHAGISTYRLNWLRGQGLGSNVSYQSNWFIWIIGDWFWFSLFWHRFKLDGVGLVDIQTLHQLASPLCQKKTPDT